MPEKKNGIHGVERMRRFRKEIEKLMRGNKNRFVHRHVPTVQREKNRLIA